MNDEELREKLAAIEHERWADWQKWCHNELRKYRHIDEIGIVQQWERQIATPYAELSDKEKASDMEQVDRYWPLIESFIRSEVEREVREAEKLWHKKRRLAKKRNQEAEANAKLKYQSMTSKSQWERNAIGDSGNEAERLNDV